MILPPTTVTTEAGRQSKPDTTPSPAATGKPAGPEIAQIIKFDTKGVEMGPWLRAFNAQVETNWMIPTSAMTAKGHVVMTFRVLKDGTILDVTVKEPSDIKAFNLSSTHALKASTPTLPLPAAYPDDSMEFTITFYFNEEPPKK